MQPNHKHWPKDKNGTAIFIGDTLVGRRDDGESQWYRVLSIDILQGSGATRLESLAQPIDREAGEEAVAHTESRYWLSRMYEREHRAVVGGQP